MKVKELIEELKQYDGNIDVVICPGWSTSHFKDIVFGHELEIEDIRIDENNRLKIEI